MAFNLNDSNRYPQVSSLNFQNFDSVDDLDMHDTEDDDYSPVSKKEKIDISNLHVSPRGPGDCTLEDLLSLQAKETHIVETSMNRSLVDH